MVNRFLIITLLFGLMSVSAQAQLGSLVCLLASELSAGDSSLGKEERAAQMARLMLDGTETSGGRVSPVIKVSDLERVADGLARGEVLNPVLESHVTRPGTGEYVASQWRKIWDEEVIARAREMDLAAVERLIREFLSEKNNEHEIRDGAREDISNLTTRIRFSVAVPAGVYGFRLPNSGLFSIHPPKIKHYDYQVTLPKRVWVAMHVVTQYQYLEIMAELRAENPAHFQTGPESIRKVFGGVELSLKPHHPIENIDESMMLEFLERLNQLAQSHDPKDVARLKKIVSDHRPGMKYQILNEPIYHILQQGLVTEQGKKLTDLSLDEMWRFAHYEQRSSVGTRSALDKDPLYYNDMPIYQFQGNVRQRMMGPGPLDLEALPPVSNLENWPVAQEGSERLAMGGAWNHGVVAGAQLLRSPIGSSRPYEDVGFRLMRTEE